LQPPLNVAEGTQSQAIQPLASLDAVGDQGGFAQDRQVLGECRHRDFECRQQFTDGAFAAEEQQKYLPPQWMGHSPKHIRTIRIAKQRSRHDEDYI